MREKLRLFYRFLERENVLKLLAVILIIVLLSGFLISFFEPGVSFTGGIWWSIVTLTTVGYGDISPSTAEGRILAVFIMFFGIGLLGMLSASLATILISKRMKENKGMCKSTVENHIIICEWNHRTKAILNELRADSETEDVAIVLIAAIEEKPVDDANLFFVNGVVCEETLEKANLKNAQTVIVLGDDSLEPTGRDAKVVLSILTIESLNPQVYSVVELVDRANEQHCQRANADEIIIGSELNSHLIARAARDHGVSRMVSELLSSRYGNELYFVSISEEMVGKNFLDIFVSMKTESNATVVGIRKKQDADVVSNPDADYIIEKDDYLLVISKDRTKTSL